MKKYIITSLIFLSFNLSFTQEIKYKLIVPELEVPWSFTFLPDDSILITERKGELIHFKNGKKIKILNLPEIISKNQGGLLDIELHPDYKKNNGQRRSVVTQSIDLMPTFLDNHKIKWTMASIFEPIMFDNKEFNELEYYKYFVEHPLYDYIDDNRFWGWPIGKHMGGNNIKSYLKDKMGDGYRRSKDDTHPNQKAHELIARLLDDYNMLQTG